MLFTMDGNIENNTQVYVHGENSVVGVEFTLFAPAHLGSTSGI